MFAVFVGFQCLFGTPVGQSWRATTREVSFSKWDRSTIICRCFSMPLSPSWTASEANKEDSLSNKSTSTCKVGWSLSAKVKKRGSEKSSIYWASFQVGSFSTSAIIVVNKRGGDCQTFPVQKVKVENRPKLILSNYLIGINLDSSATVLLNNFEVCLQANRKMTNSSSNAWIPT